MNNFNFQFKNIILILKSFVLGGAEKQALYLAQYLQNNRNCKVYIYAYIKSSNAVLIDEFFKPLMTFNSTFINKKLFIEDIEGTIDCKVDNLNLVPDDYHIHIWFVIDEDKEIIIGNAGKFTVIENNVYGTGLLPNPFYHGRNNKFELKKVY